MVKQSCIFFIFSMCYIVQRKVRNKNNSTTHHLRRHDLNNSINPFVESISKYVLNLNIDAIKQKIIYISFLMEFFLYNIVFILFIQTWKRREIWGKPYTLKRREIWVKPYNKYVITIYWTCHIRELNLRSPIIKKISIIQYC